MFLIPLLWCAIVLFGIKKADYGNPLSKETGLALRGICAIEIMLGHIGIYTEATALFPFRKAGIFITGVFFLISGYANAVNLSEKKDYKKGYLVKRFISLGIPAYLAYFTGIVGQCIYTKNIKFLPNVFNGIQILKEINWFVWELLGLYILTYIAVCIGKFKKTYYLVGIGSLIFIIVAYFIGMDETWFGCTLCYFVGMLFYFQGERIQKYVVKHKLLSIALFMTVTGLTFLALILTSKTGFVGSVIVRNAMTCIFQLVIIIALYHIKVGNRVSKWLGKYSFEIFLFHNLFLGILRGYLEDSFILAMATISCTIIFSVLYKKAYILVEGIIKKTVGKIANKED